MTLALGGKSRRRIGLLGLIAMVALFGAVLFAISAGGGGGAASAQDNDDKVTICHRTNADNNPYVVITVDKNAAGGGLDAGDHADQHQGPVWNPTLKDSGIMWGDIIPPFEWDGESFAGLNWTAEGMAIWENGCEPVMATATPTETATEAAETPTATPTVTATETAETPTATATATATETAETPTATATATATGTVETPTATATATEGAETPTATATATATGTVATPTATATVTETTAGETPETQTAAAETPATEEAVAGVRPGLTPAAPETGTGTADGNSAAKFGVFIAGILAMTAGAAMLAIRKSR